jgi:hypothetical protein
VNTLLLDTALWDLVTDASGNIAVASDPYAIAQSVASACRVFVGDQWYDTTAGIPYFQDVLGQNPSINWLKAQLVAAANAVPGCNNAIVYLSGLTPTRALTGQVQFTDNSGTTQVVGF